jgi:hypothetical protein
MTAPASATSAALPRLPDPRTAVVTGAGGPAGIGPPRWRSCCLKVLATSTGRPSRSTAASTCTNPRVARPVAGWLTQSWPCSSVPAGNGTSRVTSTGDASNPSKDAFNARTATPAP